MSVPLVHTSVLTDAVILLDLTLVAVGLDTDPSITGKIAQVSLETWIHCYDLSFSIRH